MKFKETHIKSPCSEKISNMRPCEGGLYCGVCEKTVVDLRNKTITEAQHYLNEKQDPVCIVANDRHIQSVSYYERMINGIEKFFLRFRMKKAGIAAAAFLLFIGGCRGRTYCGGWSKTASSETMKEGIHQSVSDINK